MIEADLSKIKIGDKLVMFGGEIMFGDRSSPNEIVTVERITKTRIVIKTNQGVVIPFSRHKRKMIGGSGFTGTYIRLPKNDDEIVNLTIKSNKAKIIRQLENIKFSDLPLDSLIEIWKIVTQRKE